MTKLKRRIKAEPKTEVKAEGKEYIIAVGGDIAEAVENDLIKRDGVKLFGNDNVNDEYLSLPADITEENSQELGRYFNAFTQQKMYVRTLVGRLAVIVRERNSELDSIRAEVYSSLNAKMSVKEKDLHFQTDERALESLEELVFYKSKLDMTADYLDSLVDGITLISREISRRGFDLNDSIRGENINNKRR